MNWDEWFKWFTDVNTIVEKGGFLAILAIVFAENGILFGIFLPGDYLLFLAGVLCGNGTFDVSIITLLFSVLAAAVSGSFVGYYTGKKVGKPYFQKENFFLKHKHIVHTRAYFFRFGGKTILISKFLPWVRTLAPILAGAVEMPFRRFASYNVIGGVFWVFTLVGSGYLLGEEYGEFIQNNLIYVILGFIGITSSIVYVSFKIGKMKKKKRF